MADESRYPELVDLVHRVLSVQFIEEVTFGNYIQSNFDKCILLIEDFIIAREIDIQTLPLKHRTNAQNDVLSATFLKARLLSARYQLAIDPIPADFGNYVDVTEQRLVIARWIVEVQNILGPLWHNRTN